MNDSRTLSKVGRYFPLAIAAIGALFVLGSASRGITAGDITVGPVEDPWKLPVAIIGIVLIAVAIVLHLIAPRVAASPQPTHFGAEDAAALAADLVSLSHDALGAERLLRSRDNEKHQEEIDRLAERVRDSSNRLASATGELRAFKALVSVLELIAKVTRESLREDIGAWLAEARESWIHTLTSIPITGGRDPASMIHEVLSAVGASQVPSDDTLKPFYHVTDLYMSAITFAAGTQITGLQLPTIVEEFQASPTEDVSRILDGSIKRLRSDEDYKFIMSKAFPEASSSPTTGDEGGRV